MTNEPAALEGVGRALPAAPRFHRRRLKVGMFFEVC
jgi:hypothetical protein